MSSSRIRKPLYQYNEEGYMVQKVFTTRAKLREEHRQILDEIAQQEGFQKYNVQLQDTQNEGYHSNIVLVTIKDGIKQLNLILKVNYESNFQNMNVDTFYKKEIYMYKTVFRRLYEFLKEIGSDLSIGVPKYYGSLDQNCIILENLKAKGYRLWNNQVPMDRNHLIEGLKEFARFHSVSLAMRTKEPEAFKSLIEGFESFKTSENNLKQLLKACIKAGYDLTGDDEESREILGKLQTVGEKFLLKTMLDEKYHLIVAHGDCWCNNILYKYNDATALPKDAMLVDFQIAKPGSPVRDVSYFLFVNSSKDDLQQYKEYLKIYYQELTDCLQQLSCNIADCFPEDTFENHWKTIAKYGVYISMFILKTSTVEHEHVVTKDFYEQFQISTNSLKYGFVRKRIMDLLRFVKQECIV